MRKSVIYSMLVLVIVGILSCNKDENIRGGTDKEFSWIITDSTLTISGNGAMEDYKDYVSPWYENSSAFNKVIIENGVTTIGDYAFLGCFNLRSITIGNSVTSIGRSAFRNCGDLLSITIPRNVTNIGSGAFVATRSLTAIHVDSNNPKYSSIDGIVYNKSQDTLLICPGGKTTVLIPTSVTTIGIEAFYDCLINSVTIPNNVTSIEDNAFMLCSKLNSITIPNSVTKIALSAFASSFGLTSINVNGNNPRYSSIDGILYNKSQDTLFKSPCGKEKAVIPNSVKVIEHSAFSVSYLTSITIPNSVTSIGSGAFSWCFHLTEIINHATVPQSINSYTFSEMDKSTCTLRVPASSIAAYRAAAGWRDFVNIVAIGGNVTPTLTVSTTSMNFGPSGGQQSFMINSNISWEIKHPGIMWFDVSPSSGLGNATVTVTAYVNLDASSRTSPMSIIGGDLWRSITVTQSQGNTGVAQLRYINSSGTPITSFAITDESGTITMFEREGIFRTEYHEVPARVLLTPLVQFYNTSSLQPFYKNGIVWQIGLIAGERYTLQIDLNLSGVTTISLIRDGLI